jgi:RimJ/RimL family protein N-acetyltransferase
VNAPASTARVVRLASADEPALEALLVREPVVNLFLLGFLATHPIERSLWYAVRHGEQPVAVVLVLPERLAVPYAPDPVDAATLGAHVAGRHRPSLVVGPRAASDHLFAAWTGDATARRRHDQRLYRIEHVEPGEDPDGFRPARWEERGMVAAQAAAMELEDLGRDRPDDPELDRQVVQERIKARRTWVIEREGELVFQVNVGTSHALGCQIGGTWVPPLWRGRGLATAGVAATCRLLLARHPRVTLHVNEANAPAVRVYEKVGFRRDAAFRLIIP